MKKILEKIGAIAVLAALITPLFITSNVQPAFAATYQIESPVALFETSLASSISSSATSMTLVSATTLDGTSLASSTYSFIIDEGTASQEFVRADCTSTACTNMERGISAVTGTTTVSALQKSHRRGASVKITDGPVLINIARILNGYGTLPNALSYASNFAVASSSRQLIAAYQALGMAETASTSARATLLAGNNTWTGTNLFSGIPTFSSTAIPIFNSQPTLTDDKQVATKKYVDDASFAGGVNGSETVKGVYQIATRAEAAAGTSAGSTGARLILPASMGTSTSQTATTSVVITNTSGKIDPTFLTNTTYTLSAATVTNLTVTNCTGCGGANAAASTGEDGDVTIAANATSTADKYYNNLTINSNVHLNTGNWKIFVRGTLTNNGYIENNGLDGGNGSNAADSTTGGNGGTACATSTLGSLPPGRKGQTGGNGGYDGSTGSTAGTAGGATTNGITQFSGVAGGAGNGGINSNGSAGGTGGTLASTTPPRDNFEAYYFTRLASGATSTATFLTKFDNNAGAGSGGGGGTGATGLGQFSSGGGGGGSGCGGGIVWIAANTLTNNGAITANGGNGGSGGRAVSSNGTGGAGGGGAGGANGGIVLLMYSTYTGSGTVTATGGAAGAGGVGIQSGTYTGTAGTAGKDGRVILIH
jgi:hypothetical protein